MEAQHIGESALIESWVQQKLAPAHPGIANEVEALVKRCVSAGLRFVRQNCRERVASTDGNLVTSMLNLLGAKLLALDPSHAELARVARMLIGFSFAWSFGANIDDASREKFASFFTEQFGELDGLEGVGACV